MVPRLPIATHQVHSQSPRWLPQHRLRQLENHRFIEINGGNFAVKIAWFNINLHVSIQLDSLSREDLVKYVRKQAQLLQKTKTRCDGKSKRENNQFQGGFCWGGGGSLMCQCYGQTPMKNISWSNRVMSLSQISIIRLPFITCMYFLYNILCSSTKLGLLYFA